MKISKILFTFLAVVLFYNCSSNEDTSTTPIEQKIEGTLDITTITSLPDGADITSFVSFENGVSASEYTTEAIIGDEITYTITTSSSTITTWNAGFVYSSGDLDFWNDGLESILLADIPGAAVGEEMIAGFKIKDNVAEGNELKFDIRINLVNNGVRDSKTFIIDPKIRIKAKR